MKRYDKRIKQRLVSVENQRFMLLIFLFVILFLGAALFSLDHLHASDNFKRSLSQETPTRDISLIVSDEGFYPKNIVAFSGEKVRFYVTSTTDLPSCFIVEGKDLFLEARNGEVHQGEVTFDGPGKHKFYCPKGRIRGQLTILEHPREKRKAERLREIASERESEASDVKVWLPRDE